MSAAAVVASVLLLQPVLADDMPVRVVAVDTDASTEWVLDGETVAVTAPGEPAVLKVSAGKHQLWAHSVSSQHWQAMARAQPPDPDGLAYVPAWTARSVDAQPPDGAAGSGQRSAEGPGLASSPGRDGSRGPQAALPDWALPAGVAGLAAALLLWPRKR